MNKSHPLLIVIGGCVLLGSVATGLGYWLTGGGPQSFRSDIVVHNSDGSPDSPPQASSPESASATDNTGAGPDAGPPPRSAIPDNEFGALVRKGEQIFADPGQYAGQYVGNDLRCQSCHFDAGRYDKTAPMRAAWPMYPAYRSKNQHVNDFAERLQGCFTYSMNGKAPPRGSDILQALEAYSFWLAKGTTVGESLPSKGFPDIGKPQQAPSYERGQAVFQANCALCHGADGQGQQAADGGYGFPPLWGKHSYNWGAGMHKVETAARFIKAAMPLGNPALTEQQAWDVAFFVNSHERPQDPRFDGSVQGTAKQFHHHDYARYGQSVDGQVLGSQAPPSATVP
ncbi:cytochrome c class I [Alcanivorax hongdengensis A-11-3]|uniref:Cytochrome c class I n=1 Tax=Alcanivorax hongdengensis A-11-3 TaxID=1177179 RepID=L0WFR4_9GAMM|nr:c-type cytochrome [Alcanivorax hongdengensis]EKF75693.1 cytochrome c class I [Alcanivorax hongdengensis A-11-3]